ncbi:tetratricopeptide repeat-containing protein [Halomonas sp. M4R1S46]|uniref:tetratricopeptide repeat-containing protein n=1 Tax=Halomonas sp. M4R1S46 TaxID=2982692 RepID=UPI0021E3C42A|nr:tetratricopeptide repeat-containing protein [Halomonas sp. M4R1S46]UYG07161.1 alpha/beta fold hydrolase [Halomonas sp. M4R1S46]
MRIKDKLLRLFYGADTMAVAENLCEPSLVANRNVGGRAAIVFVHGFHGDVVATWASFVMQLLSDNRLNDWDVYSAGYPTNLSIDLPIWTSDPEIRLIAAGLATKLKHTPLDQYGAVALVAHSMGGLVIQRAILDCEELGQRLTHVVLYGTPSAGLSKAVVGARLKPQARDMRAGSSFITGLRNEWKERIGEYPPFSFTVVAGETDAFVPASSSIDPYPQAQQAVVPGSHLEIVRPDSTDHPSYQLLYKTLTGARGARSAVESARLAVEHNEFDRVIELLMPGREGLDSSAIVTLSLALESVGRKDEAMNVIEQWNRSSGSSSLDPIGVLAGRLKRCWLVSRQQRDLDRALELYTEGLERAESVSDHRQAYYHAINLAFLLLEMGPPDGPVPVEVKDLARRALDHVDASHESQWSLATKGEASLMLGQLTAAEDAYRMARKQAKMLRECDSMYMQAVTVAARVFGEQGTDAIEKIFGTDKDC